MSSICAILPFCPQNLTLFVPSFFDFVIIRLEVSEMCLHLTLVFGLESLSRKCTGKYSIMRNKREEISCGYDLHVMLAFFFLYLLSSYSTIILLQFSLTTWNVSVWAVRGDMQEEHCVWNHLFHWRRKVSKMIPWDKHWKQETERLVCEAWASRFMGNFKIRLLLCLWNIISTMEDKALQSRLLKENTLKTSSWIIVFCERRVPKQSESKKMEYVYSMCLTHCVELFATKMICTLNKHFSFNWWSWWRSWWRSWWQSWQSQCNTLCWLFVVVSFLF